MPTNVFFSPKVRSEQNLYEDLVIESLRMYGQDVLYIPRDTITPDEILNEEYSKYASAYMIEMYIANTDGFGGEGNLYSKFGLEIRDQATFIVSRRQFSRLIEIDENAIREERPREGDLIYLPLSKGLFEIKFVEHETPFYQLSQLPTYELQCELFEYSAEKFETGIHDIDRFVDINATQTVIEITGGIKGFREGDTVKQLLEPSIPSQATAEAVISGGSVQGFNITYAGFGYEITSVPIIISASPTTDTATAIANFVDGELVSISVVNPGSGYIEEPTFTIPASPAEDIPAVEVIGQVSIFNETQKSDGPIIRRADLYVNQILCTDGSLKTFRALGNNLENVSQGYSDWAITKIYGINDVDRYIPNEPLAQNTFFENKGEDIIDFSEKNPFGEP